MVSQTLKGKKMSEFKDTYNIQPRYIFKRIENDFEIKYSYYCDSWRASLPYAMGNIFKDSERAQTLLDQAHSMSFFATKYDDEELKKYEDEKKHLIEIVELMIEKDAFIKKVGAAYRKQKQRIHSSTTNKRIEIPSLTNHFINDISKTFNINQKATIEMFAEDMFRNLSNITHLAEQKKITPIEAYRLIKQEEKLTIERLISETY